MKVVVPTTQVARTRVQQVKVGEIRVGTVEIDRLTLSNVHVETATGKAELHNVRLDLTLKFSLDWRVGITIDAPRPVPDFDISDSGTLDLGTLTLGIGFPDIEVPGLANLTLDIASLPVEDVTAAIGALRNLDLGSVLAEQIRAQNVVTPQGGFYLNGLGLGSARVTGVSVPDVAVSSASVGRISGGTLPIADLTIPSVELPQATIPTLTSDSIDATTRPIETRLPAADVGLLAAQLKVTTTARLRVDELTIKDVQASAEIGEIALKNVVLPFEVLGVTLSGIDLETLDIPQLEVN
jgi:hypothetical protein